jgi:hypothetical protein
MGGYGYRCKKQTTEVSVVMKNTCKRGRKGEKRGEKVARM